MSNIAINDAGDVLAFDGKDWKPATIAQNDKGERMAFDGKEWRALDGKAAAKPSTASTAIDAANTGVNWLGTQFTKGLTGVLGGADTLGELGRKGAAYIGEKVGAPETGKNIGAALKSQLTFGGLAPSTEGMNRTVFGDLGVPEVNAGDNPALTLKPPMLDGGQINVGKILDAGAQAVPGMMMLPAGAGAQMLRPGARAATTGIPAVTGGMASEAAGQATAGTPWEFPARIIGGVFGNLAGNRAVTPMPANLTPEQARAVAQAKSMNIPMSVGQETGRGRGVESAMARFPTSAGQFANLADRQATGINRAALKEAGAVGDRVDPQTMQNVFTKASNEFEAVKNAPQKIDLKPDFFNDAGRKVADYVENTASSATVPSVVKRFNDFFDPKLMKGGNFPELDGAQYQEFRRGINTAIQNTADSGAKKALQGVRGALDDAAEASLPADKAAAWKEARRNWANLKIISKAASGGSVESRAAGNLTPGALSSAARQAQGVDRFATTEGGLNDVARVAGYLADTRPNSGTPQTLAMQGAITGAPVLGGLAAGGIPGALAAGGAMAAPNILARAMTGQGWATPLGPLVPLPASVIRNYLANQAVPTARGQIPSGVRGLPMTLAPGVVVSLPRLENRQ